MTIAIITECGLSIGMGHLSRTSRIACNLIKNGSPVDLYLINNDNILAKNHQSWIIIKSINDINKKYKTTIVDIPNIIPTNISKKKFGKIITLGQPIKHNEKIHSNIVSAYGSYINKTMITGSTTHYLGAGYASLSAEYLESPYKIALKDSILISFGGTDPKNYTGKLIDTLSDELTKNFSKVTIVMGCGNKNAESIINNHKNDKISFIQNAKTLQPLLDEHQYFLCSPGVSLFEAWSRNRYAHFIYQNRSQMKDFLHFPGAIKCFDNLKQINILKNKTDLCRKIKKSNVGELLLPLIMELINE